MSTTISAFSEDHVVQLTGLTKRQLRAWDKRGFFAPHYAYEDRRAPYSRIYSFRDVVGLRTIAILLKDHHVSLSTLIAAASELDRRGYEHWADVTLHVINREVHFQKRGSEEVEGLKTGQFAMLPIIDVIDDVTTRLEALKHRSDKEIGRIERHRHVMRNAPVVAGTRITVATIQRYAEAGYSTEQILSEYPTLTERDIEAAISHREGLAQSA